MRHWIRLDESLYYCPKSWQRFIASNDLTEEAVDDLIHDKYNAYINEDKIEPVLFFREDAGYMLFMMEWG